MWRIFVMWRISIILLHAGLAEAEANSRRGNEGSSVVDGEVYTDGMEGLFDSGAELRFGRDKRMSEVNNTSAIEHLAQQFGITF